jgi:hypothetical protein
LPPTPLSFVLLSLMLKITCAFQDLPLLFFLWAINLFLKILLFVNIYIYQKFIILPSSPLFCFEVISLVPHIGYIQTWAWLFNKCF